MTDDHKLKPAPKPHSKPVAAKAHPKVHAPVKAPAPAPAPASIPAKGLAVLSVASGLIGAAVFGLVRKGRR